MIYKTTYLNTRLTMKDRNNFNSKHDIIEIIVALILLAAVMLLVVVFNSESVAVF